MRDHKQINKAEIFAVICHDGQLRKWGNVPYITHPLKVKERVNSLTEATDEMLCASVLHDIVEDCGIWYTTIANLFGDKVAEYVSQLTSRSKKDLPAGSTRAERKEYDHMLLKDASREVKIIKYCDRIENLLDTLNYETPKEWAIQYANETIELNNHALTGTHQQLETILIDLVGQVYRKYGVT